LSDLFDDLEDFGAFDDAISGDVRDPYTELARIRREEPVQRLETSGALPHEESLPMFIVYRHEDVAQMLRDNETFSSAAVIAAFGPVLGEGVMLGMDEHIHGRLRGLVSKAFAQKSLARWEDELVGRVANGLIDKFAANGKADLVKEFTFDYPSQIIAGLLGLPEADYPQFQRWSISLLSWPATSFATHGTPGSRSFFADSITSGFSLSSARASTARMRTTYSLSFLTSSASASAEVLSLRTPSA
jgi:cytochrome P450